MTGLHAAALAYAPTTVPLVPRSKRPAVTDWPNWNATPETITAHWTREPAANVGIRTGRALVVLDIDPRAGGHDVLADLEHEHGELPPTLEVITGGGGRHLYFQSAQDVPSFDLGAGLEVKAAGRQVVAPPSVHPETGAIYQWRPGHGPGELQRAPLPEWITAGRVKSAPIATPAEAWVAMLRHGLPEGQRNSGMARFVGHLLARDVDTRLVAEIARLVAAHRCRPALPEREAVRIVESIARRERAKRANA